MVRIRGFHPTGRSSILLEITKGAFAPHGFLAQLVEQQPFKLRGLGSNPRKPTMQSSSNSLGLLASNQRIWVQFPLTAPNAEVF
jgi:hypothetical protein